jgi:hypothetical protein
MDSLKTKMESKENNASNQMINEFFAEIKEYILKYKKELQKMESTKSLKMKLFDLQRQVNDLDFSNSQYDL